MAGTDCSGSDDGGAEVAEPHCPDALEQACPLLDVVPRGWFDGAPSAPPVGEIPGLDGQPLFEERFEAEALDEEHCPQVLGGEGAFAEGGEASSAAQGAVRAALSDEASPREGTSLVLEARAMDKVTGAEQAQRAARGLLSEGGARRGRPGAGGRDGEEAGAVAAAAGAVTGFEGPAAAAEEGAEAPEPASGLEEALGVSGHAASGGGAAAEAGPAGAAVTRPGTAPEVPSPMTQRGEAEPHGGRPEDALPQRGPEKYTGPSAESPWRPKLRGNLQMHSFTKDPGLHKEAAASQPEASPVDQGCGDAADGHVPSCTATLNCESALCPATSTERASKEDRAPQEHNDARCGMEKVKEDHRDVEDRACSRHCGSNEVIEVWTNCLPRQTVAAAPLQGVPQWRPSLRGRPT